MFLQVLCISVLAFASQGTSSSQVPSALTPRQCQERLEGRWEAHLAARLSIIMEIEGNAIQLFTIRDKQHSLAWKGKLAVSETIPSDHLDWTDRVSAKGRLPDNQCLYRLVGDTLLLIGGGPDHRPERFLSGQGNEPKTIVFTRID
ncbi:MAG: hypothetical protein AAGD07_21140 [Planctomycetota bacterium]